MIFDARDFLKGGLIGAIGYKPDFKIKLDAMEWFKSGYLEETDLAEIQEAIDNYYAEPEVIEPEIVEPEAPIEEPEIEEESE